MGLIRIRLWSTVCLALVFSCSDVWAQRTTGSLGGVVQDSTGAVIPGAEASVTNEATGVVRNTLTEESGAFVLPNFRTLIIGTRVRMNIEVSRFHL